MNELEAIYNHLYPDNKACETKLFIEIYEQNKSIIESTDLSISNPDYNGIIRMIADYSLALSQYGSSRKALPYLDKSIQLFQKSSMEDLTKVPMYETLLWARGIENYYQKKYSVSTKDFQYLVDNFTENDKYRNWLLASKTIKAKKILNYFWFGAFLAFIWYSLATKDNDKNRDYFLIFGIICAGIAALIQIAVSVVKASIKKK